MSKILTMDKNCFLCYCKNDVNECFSSDSRTHENCIILCRIFNVSHLGNRNNTKKFENVSYCHSCTTRIWKMKYLLDKLDKLEKEVLNEKYLIGLKLEENYQNNISDEFPLSTNDLFGIELVNEWKLKSIKLKMAKIERKRSSGSKTYCWKRTKGLRIMKNVNIYKNLTQGVVDGHDILKLPNSDKSISPLFSNFTSVDVLNEREDLTFHAVKPDIGELDLSDIFSDSQISDDVVPALTTNILEFDDIKFDPFPISNENDNPTDMKDPFEGIVPEESNFEVQSQEITNNVIHLITSVDQETSLMPEKINEGHTLKQNELKQIHIEEDFNCTDSKKIFPTSIEMIAHEHTHNYGQSYKCRYCEKTFTDHNKARIHKRVHKKEIHQKSYANADSLRKHEFRRHTELKPFKCNYCNQSFINYTDLKYHESVNTEEKQPYECKYCGKVFTMSSVLKRHERTHTY